MPSFTVTATINGRAVRKQIDAIDEAAARAKFWSQVVAELEATTETEILLGRFDVELHFSGKTTLSPQDPYDSSTFLAALEAALGSSVSEVTIHGTRRVRPAN